MQALNGMLFSPGRTDIDAQINCLNSAQPRVNWFTVFAVTATVRDSLHLPYHSMHGLVIYEAMGLADTLAIAAE